MKRFVSIITIVSVSIPTFSQKAAGKLKFEQGKVYQVTMDMNTAFAQQVGGQAIDFHVTGTAVHSYKVTNQTDDNNTLRHSMNRISFFFDGMGQKVNFNSDNPSDMEGPFGKPVKEILGKNYDIIIDPNGKVLMAQPEKIALATFDDRMRIVMDMLQHLTAEVQPPKKGEGSFFRILPENEAAIGESWSESGKTDVGDFSNTYTLAEINDTTIVVNFNGNSTATSKADMMGMETITTMNNKTTGIILVDKATGIVRQKKLNTESNGNMQVMGNSLPLTSRTTTVINISPMAEGEKK